MYIFMITWHCDQSPCYCLQGRRLEPKGACVSGSSMLDALCPSNKHQMGTFRKAESKVQLGKELATLPDTAVARDAFSVTRWRLHEVWHSTFPSFS